MTDDSNRFEELPSEEPIPNEASDSEDDFHEAAVRRSSAITALADVDLLQRTQEDELAQAELLKTDANREYAAKRYDNAIAIYKEALAYLPIRPKQDKGKGRAEAEQAEVEEKEIPELPREDEKVKKLRAALWCNMAAAEIQCVSLSLLPLSRQMY